MTPQRREGYLGWLQVPDFLEAAVGPLGICSALSSEVPRKEGSRGRLGKQNSGQMSALQ